MRILRNKTRGSRKIFLFEMTKAVRGVKIYREKEALMSKLNASSLQEVRKLADVLKGASNAVALTGAGISVPSGIPDFRSSSGLYSTKFGDFEPEVMLSRKFFDKDPQDFFKFYREKMIYAETKPNAAHFALAELERRGILSAVITQNIDGLHSDAGSKQVLELHGSVRRNFCMKCGKSYPGTDVVTKCNGVPRCDCGGIIKPDVVLYGEPLDDRVLGNAVRFTEHADVFIVIGTSLKVYPAAGLLYYFEGDTLALVNKGSTAFDAKASITIYDDCAAVFEELMKLL